MPHSKKVCLIVRGGISHRIIANILVILMGEAGCGKAVFIRKLSQFLNNEKEH